MRPTISAAEKPVTRSAPRLKSSTLPRRSAAMIPSAVASIRRSRNSLVLRSSASSSRLSETSRKVRMARPFCVRSGPAETESVTRRPSRVCTRRSAESTRAPRDSSRQSRLASIPPSGATRSGSISPRAASGTTPRMAQPAGFRVRILPSGSSTAMPSLTWLKNSS